MGYCITQQASVFHVAADKFDAAVKAIQALAGKGKSYSWVNKFDHLDDFVEIMEEWRYEIGIAEKDQDVALGIKAKKGDVLDIQFIGEKLGSDEVLFAAIAPFVTSGSYVEFSGEDGSQWRYVFNNGKMRESYGTVVWD